MSRPGPIVVVPAAKSLAAGPALTASRVFECSTDLAVSPARAFAAFDELGVWLTPNCDISLEIGGPFEIFFDTSAPEGSRGSEDCRVLALDPGRMLALTWNAPPQLDRTRGQHTTVTIYFNAAPHGCTVTLRHHGWPDDAAWEAEVQWAETYEYFVAAWPRVLSALTAHLGAA